MDTTHTHKFNLADTSDGTAENATPATIRKLCLLLFCHLILMLMVTTLVLFDTIGDLNRYKQTYGTPFAFLSALFLTLLSRSTLQISVFLLSLVRVLKFWVETTKLILLHTQTAEWCPFKV